VTHKSDFKNNILGDVVSLTGLGRHNKLEFFFCFLFLLTTVCLINIDVEDNHGTTIVFVVLDTWMEHFLLPRWDQVPQWMKFEIMDGIGLTDATDNSMVDTRKG